MMMCKKKYLNTNLFIANTEKISIMVIPTSVKVNYFMNKIVLLSAI